MGLPSMHIYNKSYATSVMFIGGVVEALCDWKINLARIGIMHVETFRNSSDGDSKNFELLGRDAIDPDLEGP
jgi:hypothetical protein|tara:strand:- start:222 stop:437 length:216 start_codon:yes stop_codon:yes gene_type:complete